jgi:hypothetical protein
MSLERDEFEKAKAVAESQGKKLVWIGDRKGNPFNSLTKPAAPPRAANPCALISPKRPL